MKLELVYINNKLVGYNIIPENEEETRALGSIRNIYFWASGENAMRYDGIEIEVNCVTKMKFIQEKHKPFFIHEAEGIEKTKSFEEVVPAPKYRCILCHSVDVRAKLWDNPNQQGKTLEFSDDDDDRKNCYCNRCETHVEIEPIPELFDQPEEPADNE